MAPRHVRVFLSSPGDLPEERATAASILESLPKEPAWRGRLTIEVVRWDDPSAPVSMPANFTPQQAINRGLKKPSECDLTVVMFWSRMGSPQSHVRKSDGSPYASGTEWEFEDAVEAGRPVLVYRKTADALINLRDPDAAEKQKQAKLVDAFFEQFRTKDGTVTRSVTPFATLGEFERVLRSHVEQELRHLLEGATESRGVRDDTDFTEAATLRPTPPLPPWPSDPYPLLRPYARPELFAGRDSELNDVVSLVTQPVLILSLHAPSGAGKSSLLQAGLLPRLRDAGHPVYLERRPGEVGLARRLIHNIIEVPSSEVFGDYGPNTFSRFVGWMTRAYRLASKPPILILDQVDEFLRNDTLRDAALARLGPLLAATAHPDASLADFPCRWILSCRRDFQGDISAWLQDVLLQARESSVAGLEDLPSNLKGDDRSQDYGLPLLGQPERGTSAVDSATRVFLAAITKPLSVIGDEGRPRYPVQFESDGELRLAQAFARARQRRPNEALVPELQVVLSHLLERARSGPNGRTVSVPFEEEALDQTITEALSAHVNRALERAFPLQRNVDAMRQGRARALLVLRDLAEAQGKGSDGVPESALIRALGDRGGDVLARLSAADMRLVVIQGRTMNGDDVYTLAHDRLADAISAAVDTVGRLGSLQIDQRVLELRHFVGLRADLFVHSHDETALELSDEQYDLIERHEPVLVVGEDSWTWWRVCQQLRTDFDAALRRQWRSPASRVQAVDRVLSRRPDPRFRPDAWYLPRDANLGFVHVPAGPFLMGSDPKRDFKSSVDEQPQHTVELGSFYVARWPVTTAQFKSFVEDTSSNEGFKAAPECLLAGDSHPAIAVSWHDARAYCRWLTKKLQRWNDAPPWLAHLVGSADTPWHVTLPTEAQWEKAARGVDGRVYPWGSEVDSDRANYDESGIGRTSPVGCFPAGASSIGVEDLAGNVWEWTGSLWGPNPDHASFHYPYVADDGREDANASDDIRRVLRGGSYAYGRAGVRAAYRRRDSPDVRLNYIGFRVVLTQFNR